jgi:hypothetical protein
MNLWFLIDPDCEIHHDDNGYQIRNSRFMSQTDEYGRDLVEHPTNDCEYIPVNSSKNIK